MEEQSANEKRLVILKETIGAEGAVSCVVLMNSMP
jgi:hypothetical protein